MSYLKVGGVLAYTSLGLGTPIVKMTLLNANLALKTKV